MSFDMWKKTQEAQIKESKAREENIKNEGKIQQATKESEIEVSKKTDEAAREHKVSKYNLTKEIFSDEKLLKMEFLRAQKKVYKRYCS